MKLCTNEAKKEGVCKRHGAKVKVKLCSSEGCTHEAIKGGVCKRHGAYHNTHDESTAFGSKYDETTATLTLPIQLASRATGRGLEEVHVPGEVTLLCQEIVGV